MNEFIKAAEALIKQMPDARPVWMIDQIKEKTQIAYPGCRLNPTRWQMLDRDMKKPYKTGVCGKT